MIISTSILFVDHLWCAQTWTNVSSHSIFTPNLSHWYYYPHFSDLPSLPATDWQSPLSRLLTALTLRLPPGYLASWAWSWYRGWLPFTMESIGSPTALQGGSGVFFSPPQPIPPPRPVSNPHTPANLPQTLPGLISIDHPTPVFSRTPVVEVWSMS